MKPLRVWASNLRTYADVDVDLPTGVAAIVGPNGAGKSTIANLVDWCLFADGGRDLASLLTTGETELELGCEFEHDGELYRVRRTYSARGGGKATLDLEARVGHAHTALLDLPLGDWRPLTRATTKDTQAALEQLLGLNRQTFQASAFCGQGAGARFTDAKPAERKQILADILQLGRWAQLETRAKDHRRAVELEQSQAQARASMLEPVAAELDQRTRDVDVLEQQETQVADEVSLAEALVAETVERQQDAQAAAARVFQARAEQATARAAFDQLDRARADAAGADAQLVPTRERIAELEPVAAGGPQLQAERAELDRARDHWRDVVAERDAQLVEADRIEGECVRLSRAVDACHGRELLIVAKIAALDEHAATCDRCGQELDQDARSRARETLAAEQHAIGEEARALLAQGDDLPSFAVVRAEAPNPGPEPAADDLDQREHDCRAAQVELASLRERAATLEQRAQAAPAGTALAEAQVALTAADDNLAVLLASGTPDLEELAREHRARSGRLQTEQARLSETRAEIAVARERVTKAAEAQADLTIAREQLDTTADRLDLLRLAEKAYGRDGIPLLIAENAIPQIEDHANQILDQLGVTYRLELRTQRELKSGGIGDTLDVIVDTPDGARPYETFSGGERTRLNLSLRMALARLLAHRRGADSRLLVVDEPDGLDQDGFERLAVVLEGLRADFDCVLVVSHHPELQTAFDTVLVVERDDAGRSRIVGATEPAAVAA